MGKTTWMVMIACLLGAAAVAAGQSGQGGVVLDSRILLDKLREKAVMQVVTSSRSPDPYLRANAVEAIMPARDRLLPIAQLALDDPHAVVRFAAFAAIGKLQLEDLRPLVLARLETERERVDTITGEIMARGTTMTDAQRERYKAQLGSAQSVQAAAIFAAKQLGAEVDMTPLNKMLTRHDPSLRANVAMLLGMLNDASAVAMLEELARAPMPRANPVRVRLARIQIAEAMASRGDEPALDTIRAGAYSHMDEVRVMCVTMLGKLGDHKMAEGMVVMLDDPPIELQLAAASTLARLGREVGLKVVLEGAKSELDPVRAQAAMALGLFRNPKAAAALATLLDDSAEQVRLSAASAILQALETLEE